MDGSESSGAKREREGMNKKQLECELRQIDVPEGTSGEWRVERHKERQCTRLLRGGRIVMTDLPHELADHHEPVLQAAKRGGQVLINGLGLGVIVQAMLELPRVRHVTVIEKSFDVFLLVAWHYQHRYGSDRFTVVRGDAFTWQPPPDEHYTVVWHDIWDSVRGANLGEMNTLRRKYRTRCDWQGSWRYTQTVAREKGEG